MSDTAVSAIQVSSVALLIVQHGAKENCCNFATFNRRRLVKQVQPSDEDKGL